MPRIALKHKPPKSQALQPKTNTNFSGGQGLVGKRKRLLFCVEGGRRRSLRRGTSRRHVLAHVHVGDKDEEVSWFTV